MEDYLKIEFMDDGIKTKSVLAEVICDTLMAVKIPDVNTAKQYSYYSALEALTRSGVIHAMDGYVYIREPASLNEANLELYEHGFIRNYIEYVAKQQNMEARILFKIMIANGDIFFSHNHAVLRESMTSTGAQSGWN